MERRLGGTGRPSGIRPPNTSSYKAPQRSALSFRPSDAIPSSSSSRKANHNLFNYPGSGGSRVSGVGGRVSVFAGFRSQFASSARKSSVTGKIGPLFGTTPQHNNRTSFQANTGSSVQSSRRASSIGGRGHVVDNRQLSDASYHRQCANKVIEFLTQNGYQHSINKRLHSHPTVGDISRIFEFLFSCFDIKQKVIPMDTKIPELMTLLEYPFPVKKSDLVSFTNGRALGSVLGMLEWLVDSLKYGQNMNPERTFYPNFDGEIDTRYELIKLCLSTSDATEGSDFDHYIEGQLKQLITKTYGTEEDYGQLIDEQEKLEQELDRLDDEINNIREFPITIQTYESDIKSYDNYISEMQSHNNSNQTLLESLDKELVEKLETLKKLEEQKKLLKIEVNRQEFGIEEAELAKQRKQQIEEEIKQENAIIEEIKKSIRSTKLECSKYEDILKKMYSDLDSFINAINDIINSPIMSDFTSNLKQLLNKDEWIQILNKLQTLMSSETNGSDINQLEKLFSTKVHELKIAIIEQLSSLQGCLTLTEQQKLNEFNLLIDEKEKQIKNYEKEVQQLMSRMESSRKEQVSEIALLQNECERDRQLLNEFENNSKRSQKELKGKVIGLRREVEEKEKCYGKELEQEMKEWVNLVNKTKSGINGSLNKLQEFKTEELTTNAKLKNVLAKSGSVSTVRKTKKQKPDKKEKENDEQKKK